MDAKENDDVRKRAYALWESEGRPDGKHEEHWQRASEEQRGDVRVSRRDGRPEPFEDMSNEGSTD
jgi:hypothetical protein